MKLSKETLEVLKNFASINLNLLIKPGNVITTKSPPNTVIASAEVAETFDKQFGIYDLSRFLGVMSLCDDPELEFTDKKVTIKEGAYSVVYYGAEPDILVYPQKMLTAPSFDVEFDVTSANIVKAIKAAAALNCNMFSFEGDGEVISIVVSDITNEGSNKFKLTLGETDKTFKAHIKIENLKFLPMDYKVSLSTKKIARFETDDSKITYYLALESTSKFD